jgi:hypothetical protein
MREFAAAIAGLGLTGAVVALTDAFPTLVALTQH